MSTVRLSPPLDERYEVLGELGAGAMGSVLRVRDRKLGRVVALKQIQGDLTEDVADRFGREAEALSRVRHPNVVEIFDYGTTPAGPFLVMELLEGQPLVGGGPEREVVERMLVVAEALDALHAEGVVHRDLKPGNVVVTEDGRPVLVDFGLSLDKGRTRLTASGSVVGTVPYMAPEVLRGADATPASDLYAWGVTLYELLEQRRPYSHEECLKVMARRPLPPPRFARIDPEGPVADALRACLQERSDRRPSSARGIRRILRRESRSGRSEARTLRKGGLGAAAGVAAALALVLGLTALGTDSAPPGVATAPAGPPPTSPEEIRRGAVTEALEGLVADHRLPDGTLAPALRGASYRSHVQEVVREVVDPRTPLRWSRFLEALGRWWALLDAAPLEGPDAALSRRVVRAMGHLRHDLGMAVAVLAEHSAGGATQRDRDFALELSPSEHRLLDQRMADLLESVEAAWVEANLRLDALPSLALAAGVILAAQFVGREARESRDLVRTRLRATRDPEERLWLTYAASSIATPLSVAGKSDTDCPGQGALEAAALESFLAHPPSPENALAPDLAGELMRNVVMRRHACEEPFDDEAMAVLESLRKVLEDALPRYPATVAAVTHWSVLATDMTLLLGSGALLWSSDVVETDELADFSRALRNLRDRAAEALPGALPPR